MVSTAISVTQKKLSVRRAYFEQGIVPQGLIDEAILRSWNRCVASDRRDSDQVAFEPVGRSLLAELAKGNAALLQAADEPLDSLAKAVVGAGYAVLLTDSHGHAISIRGPIAQRDRLMRLAFRQGVDLSESVIGTSAMSCAMAERRPVSVFGPEHFFTANLVFHCSAAPIFDPLGKIVGSVDITRDSPDSDFGALTLVSQCAQAIERALLRQLSAFMTINLSWQPSQQPSAQNMVLAFGTDGQVVALDEQARRFIGTGNSSDGLRFEDIFEARFSESVDVLRGASEPVSLRLRSGLRLFACNLEFCTEPVSRRQKGTNSAACEKRAAEFGDDSIQSRIQEALRALDSGLPILIQGETGSGKEVVAKALHEQSRHATGDFVAINCAAIPESLIEGELFGHCEGAYTGARRGGAPGKIELADGGTLFLDEIGDMPLQLQARLLRVLETREVSRLGASRNRKIDFRLICATHADIVRAVAEDRFREDLFYRINGFVLPLIPLRARRGLLTLTRRLIDEVSGGQRELGTSAVELLQSHDWPGNVRELKNALTYAHAIAEPGVTLEAEHFPMIQPGAASRNDETGPVQRRVKREAACSEAIREALLQAEGNVVRAAKILGVGRATLYRRLRDMKR